MMDIKVLSLKSAKKRRKYMESQLTGTPFSFFDALSPSDLNEKLFENKPYLLSKEAVATFETHRKVIETCDNEPLLVLEDDATPFDNNYISDINNLLSISHNWDIMIVGHFPDPRNMNRNEICETFIKYDKFIGMHSYIINPLSKNKILSQLGEPISHIDYRISELIQEDKIIGLFSKKKIFRQNNWDFPTQIPKARDIVKNEKHK
jgi:GR25 family glycosyltransferase involved in LPS biosynthesis